MTVRAWFTISALCLLALGAAAATRFFAPIEPPELMARVADQRLHGVHAGSCWPQRNGSPRCETTDGEHPEAPTIPPGGSIRIVSLYPVQPDRGSVRVVETGSGEAVLRETWTDRLSYELDPGRYRLEVEARYGENAYVRYAFGFTVDG